MVFGLWGNNDSSDTANNEDFSDHVDPTESPECSEVEPTEEELESSSDDESDFEDEWEGRAIRHLIWEDTSHFSVLTQLYGSVWSRVLPYCIVNAVLTYLIYYGKTHLMIDLTVNPTGHKYMAPLMSFLLVTRLKITFDNYMHQAKNLRVLYKACQDLVANLALLTANDTSRRARQWRQDVTYSVLVMLRVAIGVLDYSSSSENPWLLPEMNKENSEETARYSFLNVNTPRKHTKQQSKTAAVQQPEAAGDAEALEMASLKQRLAHVSNEDRKVVEEASRSVYVLALNARCQIMKQRDGTWFRSRDLVWQHPCNEETRLCGFVEEFLKAYTGLYKLVTTPIPLPIVQMNKIFLFVWLFSLPLTLCHVKTLHLSDSPIVAMMMVFILTYGFLGLEFVSMELSDPFGDDPSDFDDLGQAQLAMEDCYITIYRLDGRTWARALRRRMKTNERVPMPSPNGSSTRLFSSDRPESFDTLRVTNTY